MDMNPKAIDVQLNVNWIIKLARFPDLIVVMALILDMDGSVDTGDNCGDVMIP